ncbi:FG-GAP-like repeat-containing protein, partial [Nanoarchaeota archaeon]
MKQKLSLVLILSLTLLLLCVSTAYADRIEFSSFQKRASDDDRILYKVDINNAYADTVRLHLFTSVAEEDDNAVDKTDYISVTIEGVKPGTSTAINETYEIRSDKVQDVGGLHDSIYITGVPYEIHKVKIGLHATDSYPELLDGSWLEIEESDPEFYLRGKGRKGEGSYNFNDYYNPIYDYEKHGVLAQGWTFAHGLSYFWPGLVSPILLLVGRGRADLEFYNIKHFSRMDTIHDGRKADIKLRVSWMGTADRNTAFKRGFSDYGYKVEAGVSEQMPPYGTIGHEQLDKGGVNVVFDFTKATARSVAASVLSSAFKASTGVPGLGELIALDSFLKNLKKTDETMRGAKYLTLYNVDLQENSNYRAWIGVDQMARAGGVTSSYVNFLYSGDPFRFNRITKSQKNDHKRGIWLHDVLVNYKPVYYPSIKIAVKPSTHIFKKGTNILLWANLSKGEGPFKYKWTATTKNKTGDIVSVTTLKQETSTHSRKTYIDKGGNLPAGEYLITLEVTDKYNNTDTDFFAAEFIDPPVKPKINLSYLEVSSGTAEAYSYYFVHWNNSATVFYYQLQESTDDYNWNSYPPQDGSFSSLYRQTPGTYYYKVTAYNKLNESIVSNKIALTIVAQPPKTPILFNMSQRVGSGKRYSITWTKVDGAYYKNVSYILREYEIINLSSDTGRKLVKNITFYRCPNYVLNSTIFCRTYLNHTENELVSYEYEVAALDGDTDTIGNWSRPVWTTIVPLPQETPNVILSENSIAPKTYYNLTRTDVPGAESYRLQEDTSPSFSNPTTSPTLWHNPSQTTTYYYRARGENMAGFGNWSYISNKTVAVNTKPGKPILKPSHNIIRHGQDLTLEWNHVNAEQGYELQELKSGSYNYNQILLSGLPVTNKIITNTELNTVTHHYKVRSWSTSYGSWGDWSEPIAVQFVGQNAPSSPALYDPGRVVPLFWPYDVEWKGVANAKKFYIEEDTDPTFKTTPNRSYSSIDGTATKFSDQFDMFWHFPAKTEDYYYRIKVIDNNGYISPWSNVVDMQVLVPDCNLMGLTTPGATTVNPINILTSMAGQPFLVTWTAVTNALFYVLQEGEFYSGVCNFHSANKPTYSANGLSLTVAGYSLRGTLPYCYRAAAANICGLGPWSNNVTINIVNKTTGGGGGGPSINPIDNSDNFFKDIGKLFLNNDLIQVFRSKLSDSKFSHLTGSFANRVTVKDKQGNSKTVLKGLRNYIGVSIGDYSNDGSNNVALSGSNSVTIYDDYGQLIEQYTQLQEPEGVSIGDYNNDNINDIAIAEYNSGTVTVYDLNKQAIQTFTDLKGPVGVSIADFNNDGSNDIAIAEYNSGNVIVYNDQGNLIHHITGLNYPESVSIADYNDNGYNDLAVTMEDGSVEVYYGLIDGRSGEDCIKLYDPDSTIDCSGCLCLPEEDKSSMEFYDTGYDSTLLKLVDPLGVSIGDFDNDGSEDVAVTTQQSVDIYDTNGQMIESIPSNNPVDVFIGDFDDDNHNDIAIVENNQIIVYDRFRQPIYNFNNIT